MAISNELDRISDLKRWSQIVARFSAVILAGVPTTTLIPLPLTQLLTKRFHREEMLKELHLMIPWARVCSRHILKMDIGVEGREHLPRDTRGHMYISNHQSYVDILVLMGALDTVAFLSKKLIRFFPVLGRCAFCGGTVFMERGNQASRKAALDETIRMCHESTAVVVFPEGTRSDDGSLREQIYPRAIEEAWRQGLRVLPVGIHGTYKVFPKTMDRVVLGEPVAVRIGPALDPADYGDAESFIVASWDAVEELQGQAKEHLASLD